MKLIAITAATVLASTPAFAGVYGNVESNSGFADGDYSSTLIESHLGYEGELGNDSSWYIQGGPAFGLIPDEDNENYASGKVGASWDIVEDTTVYGEVSAMTADEWDFDNLNLGVKAGVTYRF